MRIGETLYVPTRDGWREWLEIHYARKPEIWLVSYRKATGRPSVAYNDAVEEALCFGWIDSTRKGLDEERYAQRFSPRRPGSDFSQTNKERLARLLDQGRVLPSLAAELGDFRPDDFDLPPDILAALQADYDAWNFFLTTSPSYQRIRVAYVEARRPEPDEFQKRLKNLVEKCARGRQFGHGIEKYY